MRPMATRQPSKTRASGGRRRRLALAVGVAALALGVLTAWLSGETKSASAQPQHAGVAAGAAYR